jgi:hypothetical protein
MIKDNTTEMHFPNNIQVIFLVYSFKTTNDLNCLDKTYEITIRLTNFAILENLKINLNT